MAARESTFTTLPWDGQRVANPSLYLSRLRRDAGRLAIPWPEDFNERLKSAAQEVLASPAGLLRVELTAGGAVNVTTRKVSAADGAWSVVCRQAPDFGSLTGTKHGDWAAYRDATAYAQQHGADACLLLRGDRVLDGDRCTPLILMPDGSTVIHPPEALGAVHSVTLSLIEAALGDAGFKLKEALAPLAAVYEAIEVLLLGSGAGVRQVQSVEGQAVGSGQKLFQAATSALEAARRWQGLGSSVEANELPRRWALPAEDGLLPALAEGLLDAELWGEACTGRGWAPDTLLLHSGGPISDVAEFSLLAGPPSLRFLARQPTLTGCSQQKSALKGDVPLVPQHTSRPELRWSVESWTGGGWEHSESIRGHTALAPALRAVAEVANRLAPKMQSPPDLPVSGAAIAGLLKYDLVQWTEPLCLQKLAAPGEVIGVLYRVDRWLVHDRRREALWLCAPPGDPWAWKVSCWLQTHLHSLRKPRPAPPLRCCSAVSESISDAEHAEAVRRVQEAIRAGQLYQLNYGRQWKGRLNKSPWELMSQLCSESAAPYSAFMQVPDEGFALISASPEQLLRVKHRVTSTRPIKGTCPRGETAAEDEALCMEMVASQKEVAEHMMIVDLQRHDLARVSEAGTVQWAKWQVETFPKVQHMVSSVEGHLQRGQDTWDALAAVFPGGSVTGCPKTVTIAAIDELEHSARSSWTGSTGFVDLGTGNAEWNILIRSVEAVECPAGLWTADIKAGGGITIASDPESEVAEAKLKAAPLLRAAFGEPSMSRLNAPKEELTCRHFEIPPVTRNIESMLKAFKQGYPEGPVSARGSWSHWTGQRLQPVPRRVLFLDNLDSFSLNVVNLCAMLGAETLLVSGRSAGDSMWHLLEAIKPTHVVLGPGPGTPDMYPLTMAFAGAALDASLGRPLLGICLGHQAIGVSHGWSLFPSPLGAVHGVPEEVYHDGQGLLAQLPMPARMMRYNSLVLEAKSLQRHGLMVTAWDRRRMLVMGLQHRKLPLFGVQFHPESVGSHAGNRILEAFLDIQPDSGNILSRL